MKNPTKPTEMLAQCPTCCAVKMKTNSKYMPIVWQATFVTFPKLPKETCMTCLKK